MDNYPILWITTGELAGLFPREVVAYADPETIARLHGGKKPHLSTVSLTIGTANPPEYRQIFLFWSQTKV